MKVSAPVLGPYYNPSAPKYKYCPSTSTRGLTRTPPTSVFTKDDNIPSNDRALPNPHQSYQTDQLKKSTKKNKTKKQKKQNKKNGAASLQELPYHNPKQLMRLETCLVEMI